MSTEKINDSIGKAVESVSSLEMVEAGHTSLEMTPEEEKRLVRKMDIRIFPIVTILYFLSFLDRVNIGK